MKTLALILNILVCQSLIASVDFDCKEFLSFEQTVEPAKALDASSALSISPLHFKNGSSSLRWDWNSPSPSILLDAPVPFKHFNPDPKETSISTFVFWVYSPEASEADSLRVSFLKNGNECCHFTHGLNFQGWRGAWVPFRDMAGRPLPDMDAVKLEIKGPSQQGTLFFDGIIPSVFEDVRYHTAGFDSRFINPNTDVHWLLLNKHWDKVLRMDRRAFLPEDAAQFKTIRDNYVALLTKGKKPRSLESLKKSYSLCIDKPIFFTRYAETYFNIGIKDATARWRKEHQLLRPYNDLMFDIAVAWNASASESEKAELEQMYLAMVRHLLDEGFAAGSAMGTLHHLGYSMRNFYNAPVVMQDVLRKAGLDSQVQQAMEWFSGVGECKLPPAVPGVDIDAFNTYLLGRMAAIIMLEDGPRKRSYFLALKHWIDNGFEYVSGLKPCMKEDGTVQHHRKAYPAYAVGGLEGAVRAAWMLAGTQYALSQQSYDNLKRALLEMRFYCNGKYFPLAMSGRHPDGKGALEPKQFALLAQAAPELDKELASAYLRLCPDKGAYRKAFLKQGISAESAPQGVRSYPFNCSMSVRSGEHLVTIAGFSRYMWAAETYQKANHYGRYLCYGSMQIDADGFKNPGWDWRHIPGTTAAVIPMEQMKANVLNVDEWSGYEEMLLSDQWFAGSVMHKVDPETDRGRFGAYAMILHDHDKYDGSLWARKSFFAFGDRIICMGSGIKGRGEIHTTLFQNCTGNPEDIRKTFRGRTALTDCLGNVYYLEDARNLVYERGLQHSLDEETDEPNEGRFELAYLKHSEDGADNASYVYAVRPGAAQGCCSGSTSASREAAKSGKAPRYSVISRTDALHAVRDEESGCVGAAVFEEGSVDKLVCKASPCMLMYSLAAKDRMLLSVANPDLALYEGPADEELDAQGERKERSIYGRKWVDNDCAPTSVEITLKGHWNLDPARSLSAAKMSYDGKYTIISFRTEAGRTEEISLIRCL